MYGSNADTHINLGVDSTTGTNGQDWTGATVGGGRYNNASNEYATIGGGWDNDASDNGATVGGGSQNHATGASATVGGGVVNYASGYAATVAGGQRNDAVGDYSFAAGRRAKAFNIGVFAWADSTGANFNVSSNNRFAARASGGVYFYTNSTVSSGVFVAAGGNSWSSLSDRATKENFSPVDKLAVLEMLADLPVQEYNLKSQDESIRHIGPVAQDFATFGYGESRKAINMEDADGIAFAAIQGLYQLVEAKDAEIAAMKERLATMEAAVGRLAKWQEGGQR
jgi:hypothetical protein